MPSTRAKGRANEQKAKKHFEALGYRVQLAPMPVKWATSNDFFSLWDFVAVNDKETIWGQVKSNRERTYGKDMAPHKAWPIPPNTRKLLVLYETNDPEITELN